MSRLPEGGGKAEEVPGEEGRLAAGGTRQGLRENGGRRDGGRRGEYRRRLSKGLIKERGRKSEEARKREEREGGIGKEG